MLKHALEELILAATQVSLRLDDGVAPGDPSGELDVLVLDAAIEYVQRELQGSLR